jgi:phosphate:Na+ symporter
MRWSLNNIIGSKAKYILTKLTTSPITGLIVGILLTIILQSSSIVSILVINLVSIGVLPVLNAISIILGANIGTSLTLEFIAISNPLWIWLLLILCIILFILKKNIHAFCAMSLVLLLFGFNLLKLNTAALTVIPLQLSDNPSLIEYTLALFIGVIFTAIIQSSTAATAITMTLVDNELIPLLLGVLIVYGTNIGTCFTAIIAVIGANIHAKKIMIYHLSINIISVLLILPLTPALISIINYLSNDPLQQIAHVQVLINLFTIIIFFPFIRKHALLLDKLH